MEWYLGFCLQLLSFIRKSTLQRRIGIQDEFNNDRAFGDG